MNAFELKHFTVLLQLAALLHKVVLLFEYVNEQSLSLPDELLIYSYEAIPEGKKNLFLPTAVLIA